MIDALRPLLLMFYAPVRGMREARERAPLARAALLAWLAQSLFTGYAWWPVLGAGDGAFGAFDLVSVLMQAGRLILFTAIAFMPVLIFVANIFERRGSFRLALQQEYAAAATAIFYARAAACLAALPLLMFARSSGFEQSSVIQSEQLIREFAQGRNITADNLALQLSPKNLLENFALTILLPFFVCWIVIALREVFRLSWIQSLGVTLATGLIMLPVSAVWPLFNWLFASPFLLVLLFLLLRTYFAEFTRAQHARATFKQNLEAATLNPADASAHYNLGLVHLQRKELTEARQRFERAVEIDGEEVDAHFQLGRIARAEGRLADAIKHYEQVVARDQTHAQHEIWREIGATYTSAGQFDDALDALERFLDQRSLDPEGLYLKGRALAGLGRRREAAAAMQACIEAVKTAPAYKYRTEKRWLNEAQQFLRSQA